MDTIYKTYKGEVKQEEDGSLNIFIPLSTKEMDRDGEVVEPAAFKKSMKNFMLHPVLVASHDYKDLKNQIGDIFNHKDDEMNHCYKWTRIGKV